MTLEWRGSSKTKERKGYNQTKGMKNKDRRFCKGYERCMPRNRSSRWTVRILGVTFDKVENSFFIAWPENTLNHSLSDEQ